MAKKIANDDSKSHRNYTLQRNYDYETHDASGKLTSSESPEQWKQRVKNEWGNMVGLKSIAMIFHDKDTLKTDDGKLVLKPLHAHAVVTLKSAKTRSAMQKQSGVSSIRNVEPINDMVGASRYLCHLTEQAINDGKYNYDRSLVYCLNCNYADMVKAKSKNKDASRELDSDFIATLGGEIQSGSLGKTQAKQKLFDYFMKAYPDNYMAEAQKAWRSNRLSFDADVNESVALRARYQQDHGRELTNFYIWGSGGSGKTNLAEAMAYYLTPTHEFHSVGVGGKGKTFDMVSGYNGERVSVMNEIEPSAFKFREFLSNFDPHHVAVVNSRNIDKAWLAEYSMITFTDPLERWLRDLMIFSKGSTERYDVTNGNIELPALMTSDDFRTDWWQGLRRFKFEIQVVRSSDVSSIANLYYLDDHTHRMEPVSKSGVICDDVRDRDLCRKWAHDVLTSLKIL